MKMQFRKTITSVILSLLLLGCSAPVPVPQNKLEYVGLWVANDRFISIFPTGRLEYKEKLRFGMHNRVESNFVFSENRIETTMFATFIINKPPFIENKQWKMVVDNVLYVRTGAPVTYGKSNKWPKGIH